MKWFWIWLCLHARAYMKVSDPTGEIVLSRADWVTFAKAYAERAAALSFGIEQSDDETRRQARRAFFTDLHARLHKQLNRSDTLEALLGQGTYILQIHHDHRYQCPIVSVFRAHRFHDWSQVDVDSASQLLQYVYRNGTVFIPSAQAFEPVGLRLEEDPVLTVRLTNVPIGPALSFT